MILLPCHPGGSMYVVTGGSMVVVIDTIDQTCSCPVLGLADLHRQLGTTLVYLLVNQERLHQKLYLDPLRSSLVLLFNSLLINYYVYGFLVILFPLTVLSLLRHHAILLRNWVAFLGILYVRAYLCLRYPSVLPGLKYVVVPAPLSVELLSTATL